MSDKISTTVERAQREKVIAMVRARLALRGMSISDLSDQQIMTEIADAIDVLNSDARRDI